MTPGQQSRRDTTEEMRRQQQADERIRELEQEIEQLRASLRHVGDRLDYIGFRMQPADWASHDTENAFLNARADVSYALDGGGDDS
jgi:uncharacterized protein HemX